jgi:O-succinylhomoserine sulfhydrylase
MSKTPLDPAKIAPAKLHPETRAVHSGSIRSGFGETSEALFLTQGFVYDSAEECAERFENNGPGYIYSRFSNPTVAMFEERIAALEGAEAARGSASGMAAVTIALMGLVKAGDHVVAASKLFGSCRYIVEEWLPRFGVASTLVDGTDLAAWQAAVRPQTRAFLLESPTNPTLDVLDIAAIAAIAQAADAKLVVDNVFATPLLQSPLELGAHVVVYSTTKHIDGQGRCLGGAILTSEQIMKDHYQQPLRQTGPSMSPFNAWVMLKGLETLHVRVERHPQAAIIQRQMKGGGTLVGLEVMGGREGAFRFLNALKLIRISNNLGDSKSLITHPATTTHQRFTPEERAGMGISEGFLRLSVGLEHADDLIADIDAALAQV